MIFKNRKATWGVLVSGVIAAAVGCDGARVGRKPVEAKPGDGPGVAPAAKCAKAPIALGADETILTILGTNDIHGAIAPKARDGKTVGGMAFWAGAVKSIRAASAKSYGERGGVLVLDGGDQFQGTLLSNYSEGALFFSLMNDVGYDAAVPGNHDYDFGPEGWLVDQVTPDSKDQDPRGVIKKLAGSAAFPLLSSNAYLKASLKTIEGKPTTVESSGCGSKDPIDWSKAERPEFLRSYVVRETAGVRVALVGLDNVITPTTTTAANVSDLCFRDPLEEYRAVREELEGKADLFVLVIHDGDINNDKNLTKLIRALQAYRPDAVDAVVGGHTHSINFIRENGVVGIQSGANGERFGRIDLVIDAKTKKVVREKTRAAAGALLYRDACDPLIDAFCEAGAGVRVTYDCEAVVESASALEKIAAGEKDIGPLTGRDLGTAETAIRKDRDNESPLLNLLTDAYRRAATGADVAMINTGGVRTDIAAGPFTYEKLYAISPFNNRAVVLDPMKVETLVKIMTRSARTCGKSGAVLGSGLRVTYERGDCKQPDANGEDPNGRVVTIHLDAGGKDGELLYDARDPKNVVTSDRTLRVATLDFLEAGGSGYVFFKEAPRAEKGGDLGIFREVIADELAKNPGKLEAKIDGRFRNLLAQ